MLTKGKGPIYQVMHYSWKNTSLYSYSEGDSTPLHEQEPKAIMYLPFLRPYINIAGTYDVLCMLLGIRFYSQVVKFHISCSYVGIHSKVLTSNIGNIRQSPSHIDRHILLSKERCIIGFAFKRRSDNKASHMNEFLQEIGYG